MNLPMQYFWGLMSLALFVIEGLAPGLVSIWFAIGALAAVPTALLNDSVVVQCIVFVVVSALTLYFTRPLAKKYLERNKQPTNADRVIGEIGTVKIPIRNLAGEGTVFVSGAEWSAYSLGPESLEEGSRVIVREIKGVRLGVLPENMDEAK